MRLSNCQYGGVILADGGLDRANAARIGPKSPKSGEKSIGVVDARGLHRCEASPLPKMHTRLGPVEE